MKVLYMTKPGNVSPWYEEFVAALGGNFDVVTWAPTGPLMLKSRTLSRLWTWGLPSSRA